MHRLAALSAAAVCALLVGCSAGSTHSTLPAHSASLPLPHSVSPGLVKPAPMAKTPLLPSSAMTSLTPRRTQSAPQALNWTQMPGAAVQIVPASDGSIWALSTEPAGSPDKYIWHYAGGVWTNIPGAAKQLAVVNGPIQTVYAINTGGGTYAYSNGSWQALGGGASDLTVSSDGTVYVISNDGSGAIWKNTNGTWVQSPGAGVYLAGAQDASYYTVPGGHISPDGIYVLNSAGSIYYLNNDGTYVSFPGAASAIAPTQTGGAFVLSYPASANGGNIYYYDLSDPHWIAQPGTAQSIAAGNNTLYVVNSAGAIYSAPITSATALPPSPGQFGAWGPYDIANAFQYPVQAGYDGSGITIAVVIDTMPSTSDLSTYLAQFGIKRTGTISSYSVDGGGGADMDGEATLDTETIAGLAPGANVVVYTMGDLGEQHMLDAWNTIISGGKTSVISMSFGGCEFNGEDQIEGPILAQAASKGIAVVASSGDWGNECPGPSGTPVVGPNGPASNPNIVSVGGVETTENRTIAGNSVWNDCPSGLAQPENCMGSGGVSGNAATGFTGYPIPAYQQGLAGTASGTKRNLPDISLPADFASLYMSNQGGWLVAGGTSWSAPEAAAMIAEIYQYCSTATIANPVTLFYNAFSAARYGDFVDVTGGNDQFMGSTPYYSASAGYDDASGIGEPLGMSVARTACPNRQLALGSRVSLAAQVPLLAAAPRVFARVPNIRGMSDLGERASSAPTRVAIVLRETSSLASDEPRVVAELAAAGFTIERRYADHLLVDASAPATVVERYFGTRIHTVVQKRYGERYANVSAMTIPAGVAPYVSGVVADNLVLRRPFFSR